MSTKDQAIQFAQDRKKLTDELTNLVDDLDLAERDVIWRESLFINEIANATDEAGKPLYSSEDKRKNALVQLRTTNKDLFQAHHDVSTVKRNVALKEAQIRHAADMVRILCAFAAERQD